MEHKPNNTTTYAIQANGRQYDLSFQTGHVVDARTREIVTTTPSETFTTGGGGYVTSNAVGQVHGSIAPTTTRHYGEHTTRRQVTEGFLADSDGFEWPATFHLDSRVTHVITEIKSGEELIGQYNHTTRAATLVEVDEAFMGCVEACDEAARDAQRQLDAFESSKQKQHVTEKTSWWSYPVTPAAGLLVLVGGSAVVGAILGVSDRALAELMAWPILAWLLVATPALWFVIWRKRRAQSLILSKTYLQTDYWQLWREVNDQRRPVFKQYCHDLKTALVENAESHRLRTGL